MKNRLLTGIISGLYLAIVTYLGGFLFKFTFLGITMIALYEIEKAIKQNKSVLYKLNYVMALYIFGMNMLNLPIGISLLIPIFSTIAGIVYVLDRNSDFKSLNTTFFSMFYIVLLLYHSIIFENHLYIWLVYAISFSGDSVAYLVGSSLGKMKLCPELSPKKTIEGAVGGIVGAVVAALILNLFILKEKPFAIFLIALIASIASILGDLVASKIKREFKIKDFGNMLPGHGGIMDRFDSFILVVPVTYYLVVLLS